MLIITIVASYIAHISITQWHSRLAYSGSDHSNAVSCHPNKELNLIVLSCLQSGCGSWRRTECIQGSQGSCGCLSRVSFCPPTEIPPDSQYHLSGEELYHHLPLTNRPPYRISWRRLQKVKSEEEKRTWNWWRHGRRTNDSLSEFDLNFSMKYSLFGIKFNWVLAWEGLGSFRFMRFSFQFLPQFRFGLSFMQKPDAIWYEAHY